MKEFHTRIYATRSPGKRAKIRRQAAKAEEWILGRIRDSLATESEWREWQMKCVRRQWEGCRRCPLSRDSRVVMGHGAPEPLLVVVGGFPTGLDLDRRRVLAGPEGAVLRKTCERIGINLLRDAWTTAAVACHTTRTRPTQESRSACGSRLKAELRVVQPPVLLLLGKTALHILEGVHRDDTVADFRGLVPARYWPSAERLGVKPKAVFVTYHPRRLLALPTVEEKRRMLQRFVADLKKVKRVLDRLIEKREGR